MKPCSVYSPERLAQYLKGELPADEERAVEVHAAGCAACLAQMEARAGELARPGSRFPPPPPADPPAPSRADTGPTAPESPFPPPTAPAPPELARYEVREQLGHGGMGTVWLAFDRTLKRVVALKTLLPAEETEGEEVRRFFAEAEAVAKLDHPGIVRIYDVGAEAVPPFLSLEYCPGGTLKDRLAAAGGPLPPKAAARLTEALADAMQHAHERGVVHRDLKPANVLIVEGADTPLGRCHVKVADFGLAKRLDVAGPTVSGALVGTLAYMAPEQARGKGVGPASDVHALGVMLYEMLTGRLPYQGVTAHDTLLQIVHDEPKPPRQLQPRLSRDLETICLKCLEKEPGLRYPGAGDLADDLRRFLDGEAIVARPPSTWRRGGRWVRRRAAGVTVAALVLFIVVGSLGGWGWVRHSRQRERAAFANVRASLKQSLAAFDVARFTPGADGGHDPTGLQKELADKVPLYEAMIREDPEDEELRAELATIYRRLAWLEALSGDRDKAVALTQKVRALLVELETAHPGATPYESDLADVHSDLGTLHGLDRQWDEAREAYREAIRRRERLVAKNVGGEDEAGQLAAEWLALTELHHARPNPAEADAALAKAEEVYRRHPGIGLAFSLQRAQALLELGREQEADEAFRDALARLDEDCQPGSAVLPAGVGAPLTEPAAREAPPDHPVRTFRDLIRSASAEENIRKAVEFHARKAKEHPDQPAYRERLARSRFYLTAMIFRTKGAAGAEEALAAARQGADAYDDLLKANPTNGDYSLREAQLCWVTAGALLLVGRKDQAETWCAKGLAVLDAATLGDGQQVPGRAIRRDILLVRGNVMGGRQRYPEALADFSRAFEIDPRVQQGQQGEYYAVIVEAARRQMIVERLRKGRHAEAVADAEALAAIPGIPGEALYDGACVYGVASAAEKDPARREKYAARSVALLRMAFAAGFGKDPHQAATGVFGDPVRHVEGDADLAAVRGRDDYTKLLADLTRQP